MTPLMVGLLCCALTVLILIWDLMLYSDDVPDNSISQVIIGVSKKSAALPALIGFFVGFLFGHWFA